MSAMLTFLWKYRKIIAKILVVLIVLYFAYKIVGGIWALIIALLSGIGLFPNKKKESIEIERREIDDYKEFIKKKKEEHQKNKEEAEKLEKEMQEFLEELRRWQ